MTVMDSTVAVWTDPSGVPERIVWHAPRYRVSDRPTRLEPDFTLITHPVPVDGWRFQGTAEDGTTRIFDVLFSAPLAQWRVVHVYE
jgi:hypothetical protein